jgi:hypothetical protein
MITNQKRDGKTARTQGKLSDRTDEFWENSEAAAALKRLKANPRIKYVVISAPEDACPACQQLVGTYQKDNVPQLPFEHCSHPHGCRAFYAPFIEELFP